MRRQSQCSLLATGVGSDYLRAIRGGLRQVGLPLGAPPPPRPQKSCPWPETMGPALNDSAAVLVGTGPCSWQIFSVLCAGDVVFSEFLPVWEPRNACLGGPGTCFPSRRAHAWGMVCSFAARSPLLPTGLHPHPQYCSNSCGPAGCAQGCGPTSITSQIEG